MQEDERSGADFGGSEGSPEDRRRRLQLLAHPELLLADVDGPALGAYTEELTLEPAELVLLAKNQIDETVVCCVRQIFACHALYLPHRTSSSKRDPVHDGAKGLLG